MNGIIEKIKKLLSLSKSDNEHEAANAAAAAASLMARHQISMAHIEVPDDPSDVISAFTLREKFKKKVVWKGDLFFGVCASFGCQYFWNGSSPCLVGYKSDVDSVTYIYQYLVREINRLAEESWNDYYFKSYESARAYKTSFRRGAAMIVRKRLQDSRKENLDKEKQDADAAKTQAIIRVEVRDFNISKHYEAMVENLKMGKFNPSNKVSSLHGLQAGEQAGEKIKLGTNSKGLKGSSAELAAPQKMLGN